MAEKQSKKVVFLTQKERLRIPSLMMTKYESIFFLLSEAKVEHCKLSLFTQGFKVGIRNVQCSMLLAKNVARLLKNTLLLVHSLQSLFVSRQTEIDFSCSKQRRTLELHFRTACFN
jgi:hypothetical protein